MSTVYEFKVYDIGNDEWKKSCRWGTLDGINRIRGTALEETVTTIDDSLVGPDGLTERNFSPRPFGHGSPRVMS